MLESQCSHIQLLLLADFGTATEQNFRVNLCFTIIFATTATACAASRPLQLACPRNLEPQANLVGVLATQLTPNRDVRRNWLRGGGLRQISNVHVPTRKVHVPTRVVIVVINVQTVRGHAYVYVRTYRVYA